MGNCQDQHLKLMTRLIQSKIQVSLASVSCTQAFQVEEKGPGTLALHMHAPGDPRKTWGNRILSYTLHLSSIQLHIIQNDNFAMKTPVHAHAVCTGPFPLLEGPGYRSYQPTFLLSQSGPAM